MSRKLQISIEVFLVFSPIIYQIWFAGRKSFLPAILALFIVIVSWISRFDLTTDESRKECLEYLGLWPKTGSLVLVGFLLLLILSSFSVIVPVFWPKLSPRSPNQMVLIFSHALRYFGWAFFQQLLLNGYFARRLKNVFRDTLSAAVATGIVFSLVHTPNPLLMIVTLFTGIGSGYVFLKDYKFAGLHFRNLYILAIVHVAIGVCIAHYLPAWLTLHMKVGPSALSFLGMKKP